jgi:hypothetical protein
VKALLTSSSTMSSRSSVLEDAGAGAGDEEDPELLQMGVAVQSAQHLLRGDEDANDGEQGDGGQEFYFHDQSGRSSGILGYGEGGAKVREGSTLACYETAGDPR